MTLNVWALPWSMARHTRRRLIGIAEALPGLDADLVALQEVWTEEARSLLLQGAEVAGYESRWHNRGQIGGSGLLVLSRLPIREARFDAYQLRGRPERVWHGDYWGGKGFALLGLETPEGPLALVNTHLHAQYEVDVGDEYRATRMGQVVQIAAGLDGVAVPLVAAGDFNLREDQAHYRVLTGLTRLRDAADEAQARQPTVTEDNPYRRDRPRANARIDYVFVRNGADRGLRVRSAERVLDGLFQLDGEPAALSDHAGLRVDLELAAAKAGPSPAPDPEAGRRAREILEEGRRTAAGRRSERRAGGGIAAAAGALALAASRPSPLGRRGFLRGLAFAGGALALPAGIGGAALGEWAGRREERAYADTLARLDAMLSRRE